MTVARTSKDGVITVAEVTIDGKQYDLPSWLTEEDFAAGLRSTKDDDALSSLVSCKLEKWDKDGLSYDGGSKYNPIFEVKYEVPLSSVRELVVNVFAPVNPYDKDDLEITVVGDTVTVTMLVKEYTDFNDIQLLVLPEDFATRPIPTNMTYMEEVFEELVSDFDDALKYREHRLTRFTSTAGEAYFALLFIHED